MTLFFLGLSILFGLIILELMRRIRKLRKKLHYEAEVLEDLNAGSEELKNAVNRNKPTN